MPNAEPELLAATPSDTLRKLRAQLIVGDVTDRLGAVTHLLTTLLDKEMLHADRAERDKKAAELVAKAAEAAAKIRAALDGEPADDEAPHPAATARPAAGATARR